MTSDNFELYHEYLKKKSRLGDLYRKFYLFPKLSHYLEGRTLDVGCGTGDFCKFRKNTEGADINYLNVNRLKDHGISAFLIENDLLPQDSATYDSVLLDNVLEHIAQPENLVREIFRVLKPKGKLLVGVPGVKGFEAEEDHKVFYDKEKLIRYFESQGFKIRLSFWTPFKLNLLNSRMRQYCLYAVFQKQ